MSRFKHIKADGDHKYVDCAICPSCGYIYEDSSEFSDGQECECEVCSEGFSVEVHVFKKYSTSAKEPSC